MLMTDRHRQWLSKYCGVQAGANDEQFLRAYAKELASPTCRLSPEQQYDLAKEGHDMKTITATGEFSKYSTDQVQIKHAKTGKPVMVDGQPAYGPSELDTVKIGVWMRHFMSRKGLPVPPLSEHESNILRQMYAEDSFAGQIGDRYHVGRIPGGETESRYKSLLNDSDSGGQWLIPLALDNMAVVFPLLNGELAPFVDNRQTDGGTIRVPVMNQVDAFWGQTDGSEVALFSTEDLIDKIEADLCTLAVAIEFSRDLAADSPLAVGSLLTESAGQRFLSELDRVIAVGNGVDEPEGLFTASGISSLTSENDTTGPITGSDLRRLIFSVPKQYRTGGYGCAFVANDTTYARCRGLEVNPSTDQRLVFGDDLQSYELLQYPFRISNDLPNTKGMFVALKRYRLWRRQGVTVEMSKEGESLMRRNQNLLVIRGRWAGKMTDANAAIKMSDLQDADAA